MRLALALPLLLAACIQQTYPDPGPGPTPDPGWGTGPGGTGGNSGFCERDTDCGSSSVCARDGECLSSSEVRTIHVTWTVSSQPASEQSCAATPHLDLTFLDTQSNQFGFSPVPCVEGKFTIDRLPTWYGTVELSRTGDYGAGGATASFDTDGVAVLDLGY